MAAQDERDDDLPELYRRRVGGRGERRDQRESRPRQRRAGWPLPAFGADV